MKFFKVLVLLAAFPSLVLANDILFDNIETKHWQTINDSVMGGISTSRFYFQYDQGEFGYGVFEGDVSLANNGGFASIRRVISPDFSNGGVVRLVVKGDGRKYQLRLKTHDVYQGAAYVAEFTTKPNQWQQLSFTEDDFSPRFRGRDIQDAPPLKFGDAIQVGLLIGDKTAGKFKLQVQAIEVLEAI
ncbi:CIA30 family protein [Thalassotalea montiporae]